MLWECYMSTNSLDDILTIPSYSRQKRRIEHLGLKNLIESRNTCFVQINEMISDFFQRNLISPQAFVRLKNLECVKTRTSLAEHLRFELFYMYFYGFSSLFATWAS